jgi:hypothetical protein
VPRKSENLLHTSEPNLHTTTEVIALPHLFNRKLKFRSFDSLSNLRNANETKRSGKEPHLSRVVFIAASKRLKD